MARIRNLFLLLTFIGPLHIAEQLLTGIDEFYSIRAVMARYYALFDSASADYASVLLITAIWTAVSVLLYALLWEGTPRLLVLGLFGVFGGTELHHIIESVVKRAYDPGAVTCVPYAIVGCLLIAAVIGELNARRQSLTAQRSMV